MGYGSPHGLPFLHHAVPKIGALTLIESQEYDIYCWAKDSAIDTAGNARPNYQTQSYVEQLVGCFRRRC